MTNNDYQERPTVSILCATKNEPRLIDALLSIINCDLDFNDIEILIKEGGSFNHLAYNLLHDKKYKFLYLVNPDHGPYDAMNTLIKNAKGEYSIILNSDDMFDSAGLSSIIFLLKSYKPDILFADVRVYKSSTASFSFNRRLFPRLGRLIHPIFAMPVAHGGFICKTTLLKNNLFKSSAGLEADYCQILDILNLPKLSILDVSNLTVSFFSLGGLSGNRYFFSSSNPHLVEDFAILKTSLSPPLKLSGFIFRILKILLLIPCKAFQSLASR